MFGFLRKLQRYLSFLQAFIALLLAF